MNLLNHNFSENFIPIDTIPFHLSHIIQNGIQL